MVASATMDSAQRFELINELQDDDKEPSDSFGPIMIVKSFLSRA
jgi:hypothetical protein